MECYKKEVSSRLWKNQDEFVCDPSAADPLQNQDEFVVDPFVADPLLNKHELVHDPFIRGSRVLYDIYQR